MQKAVYWLATARKEGEKPAKVLSRAVVLAGYKKTAAKLTKDALLRNLDIAEKLGCLDDAGLAAMRRGNAATVRKGPYKGDELSVDHIVPRAVVPELDNVIANLELMPLRMNESKNAKIGDRQRDMAKKLYQAELVRLRPKTTERANWTVAAIVGIGTLFRQFRGENKRQQ